MKICLPGVEVMLILPAIEASVVFLYYSALFIKEFALFIVIFLLFLIHELATTVIASPNALDLHTCTVFVLSLPLILQVEPVLLNRDRCIRFFFPEAFCLIQALIV
jgi:hypothetical protein